MEGVPTHLDYDAIGRALAALPGVTGRARPAHLEHVDAERVALSAHLALARRRRLAALLAQAQRMLATRLRDRHATLQPTWPVPARARRRIGA